MNSGYSKTPLVKKLGIKENFSIKLYNTPHNYFDLLSTLPDNIEIVENTESDKVDFVHYFGSEKMKFLQDLLLLRDQIKQNGMIWISWDKTRSRLPDAINENIIRQRALSLDLVDIKVCAVDQTWSGLKLVIRKEKRTLK